MELAIDNPFAAVLGDGETILWMGKPDKDCCIRSEKRQRRLIAFVLLSVVLFMMLLSLTGNASLALCVTGSAFLLAFALGFLFCSVGETIPPECYALTDKRVLLHDPLTDGSNPITQIAIKQVMRIDLSPKAGPSSAVVFQQRQFLMISRQIVFYIADAAEVQGLATSLLTGRRESA